MAYAVLCAWVCSATHMCLRKDLHNDQAEDEQSRVSPDRSVVPHQPHDRTYSLRRVLANAPHGLGWTSTPAERRRLMQRIKAVPAARCFTRARLRKLMLTLYTSKVRVVPGLACWHAMGLHYHNMNAWQAQIDLDQVQDRMDQTRFEMSDHMFNYMWQQYGDLELVRNYYAVVVASAHRTRIVDPNVDVFLAFLDGRWSLDALNIFLTAYMMLNQSQVGESFATVVMQQPRSMRNVPVQREDLRRCLAVCDAILGPIHKHHRHAIVSELQVCAMVRPPKATPAKPGSKSFRRPMLKRGYTESALQVSPSRNSAMKAEFLQHLQETAPQTYGRPRPTNASSGGALLALAREAAEYKSDGLSVGSPVPPSSRSTRTPRSRRALTRGSSTGRSGVQSRPGTDVSRPMTEGSDAVRAVPLTEFSETEPALSPRLEPGTATPYGAQPSPQRTVASEGAADGAGHGLGAPTPGAPSVATSVPAEQARSGDTRNAGATTPVYKGTSPLQLPNLTPRKGAEEVGTPPANATRTKSMPLMRRDKSLRLPNVQPAVESLGEALHRGSKGNLLGSPRTAARHALARAGGSMHSFGSYQSMSRALAAESSRPTGDPTYSFRNHHRTRVSDTTGDRPVAAVGTAKLVDGFVWGASHLHGGDVTVSARRLVVGVHRLPCFEVTPHAVCGGIRVQNERSQPRGAELPAGWVIPRLDFLRVLVKHYVHLEHNLFMFLQRLFTKHDRWVRACARCTACGRAWLHVLYADLFSPTTEGRPAETNRV